MAGMDRFGVYLFPWGKQPPTVDSIVDLAVHAENLGFDSVHVPWHFTIPASEWIFPEFGNHFMLDPLVVVPAIVRETKRIRVSLNAAIVPTLHPFMWGQYLASLDVLSGGRTLAAAAVGWWHDDFRIGQTALRGRGKRMDEALEILRRLWAGETLDEAASEAWDVAGLSLDPTPAQQPLPLWIGGGERSIERAARWGDALFPLDMTPAAAGDLAARVHDAGAQHGRDVKLAMMNYSVITDDEGAQRDELKSKVLRCMSFTAGEDDAPEGRVFLGPAEQCGELVQRFFDVGVDYIVLDCQLHGWEDEAFAREQMSRFAEEVVPNL